MAAETKARLEDIYLPFKPKRRTKAQIAREAGLEPLADGLLGDPTVEPAAAAAAFVDADKGVADAQAALDGARAILTERFSEDADLIGELRERMWGRGQLAAKVREGKEEAGAKFADYFDFSEPFTALPSHRILAMLRGEKEEILDLTLEPEEPGDAAGGPSSYEPIVADRFGIRNQGRPGDKWLSDTVRWAWRTRILVHLGLDLRLRLRTAAEDEAVQVFAANLRDLLLAAPAGTRDAGPRPRLPHGREGRGRRRDGQGRGDGRHPPARAREPVGRGAGQAGPSRPGAHGRPDRDRQRHGVARDRQARR